MMAPASEGHRSAAGEALLWDRDGNGLDRRCARRGELPS
jgi:hypothetical protein